MRLVFLLLVGCQFSIASSKAQSCNQMTDEFTSYIQAINSVKHSSFKFTDEIITSKSSWIRAASYYSCDGKTGYFIFKTDEKEYIHANMPVEIWNAFKNAPSYGSFYNRNIKYRYQLFLVQKEGKS
jgi:hypothetical protein